MNFLSYIFVIITKLIIRFSKIQFRKKMLHFLHLEQFNSVNSKTVFLIRNLRRNCIKKYIGTSVHTASKMKIIVRTVSKAADIVSFMYGLAMLSSSQKKPLLKGCSTASNTINNTSNTMMTKMLATKLNTW